MTWPMQQSKISRLVRIKQKVKKKSVSIKATYFVNNMNRRKLCDKHFGFSAFNISHSKFTLMLSRNFLIYFSWIRVFSNFLALQIVRAKHA